jgi:hypothetical protein
VQGGVPGPAYHDELGVAGRCQCFEFASDLALPLTEVTLNPGVAQFFDHGLAQPLVVPVAFDGG